MTIELASELKVSDMEAEREKWEIEPWMWANLMRIPLMHYEVLQAKPDLHLTPHEERRLKAVAAAMEFFSQSGVYRQTIMGYI